MLREKTDLKMARTGGYRRSAVCRPCGVTPHAALQNKKRRLLRFPGYYQYSNEIALIR